MQPYSLPSIQLKMYYDLLNLSQAPTPSYHTPYLNQEQNRHSSKDHRKKSDCVNNKVYHLQPNLILLFDTSCFYPNHPDAHDVIVG